MAISDLDTPPRALTSRLSALRTAIVGVVGLLLNLAVFLGIALIGGIWSSWVMVDHGSALVTRTSGAWVLWTAAGRPDADPYTRAHFARQGGLPVSTTAVHAWEARSDDEGQKLHSSCEYVLEGDGLAAEWWSLAVFDERGSLITNSAERYAYNMRTAALSPDGGFIVTLARDARPGNWLPTGGAGRLALVFTRPAPRPNATPTELLAARRGLPAIRRIACR